MLIKTGFDISFAAEHATPMVIMLSIHPSRIGDIVGREQLSQSRTCPIHFYHDSFGNFCGRLTAPAGGVRLWGSALVRDSGLLDAVDPNAIQHPIEELPDECLLYLMSSRYCETDKLTDIAWSLFPELAPGLGASAGDMHFCSQSLDVSVTSTPIRPSPLTTPMFRKRACVAILRTWRSRCAAA